VFYSLRRFSGLWCGNRTPVKRLSQGYSSQIRQIISSRPAKTTAIHSLIVYYQLLVTLTAPPPPIFFLTTHSPRERAWSDATFL
jgi:hypothetical protein